MMDFKKKAVRENMARDAAREAALQKGDYVAKLGVQIQLLAFKKKDLLT